VVVVVVVVVVVLGRLHLTRHKGSVSVLVVFAVQLHFSLAVFDVEVVVAFSYWPALEIIWWR